MENYLHIHWHKSWITILRKNTESIQKNKVVFTKELIQLAPWLLDTQLSIDMRYTDRPLNLNSHKTATESFPQIFTNSEYKASILIKN